MVDGGAGSGSEQAADLELVRVCVAPEGAFGIILAEGLPCGLVTAERTYATDELHPRGPEQYVKIPAGRYLCRRTRYEHGDYDTYEVTGVVGHSRLLIHKGNTELDSEGCILLGQRFGLVRGMPAVLESAIAFAVFLRLVRDAEAFTLVVRAA